MESLKRDIYGYRRYAIICGNTFRVIEPQNSLRNYCLNTAKGIEKNLERGAFTSIDPMVIICENTFRIIKPQNPVRELLPTIPERVS